MQIDYLRRSAAVPKAGLGQRQRIVTTEFSHLTDVERRATPLHQ